MASDQLSLGTQIRRARERRHLTQPQLAEAVGVSVRAVGDWERDRTRPKNRLGALEAFLGVSLTGAGETAETYTDPTERSLWEDTSLPEAERRDLIGQLRERRAAHARTQRPPA